MFSPLSRPFRSIQIKKPIPFENRLWFEPIIWIPHPINKKRVGVRVSCPYKSTEQRAMCIDWDLLSPLQVCPTLPEMNHLDNNKHFLCQDGLFVTFWFERYSNSGKNWTDQKLPNNVLKGMGSDKCGVRSASAYANLLRQGYGGQEASVDESAFPALGRNRSHGELSFLV